MDNAEIKVFLEWCDEIGLTEHEMLDFLLRIENANSRKEAPKTPAQDK